MGEQITTKKLYGLRVIDEKKGKRLGKVRRFVFHPSERRCIGLLVKRPDAALMFHRKDLFVALNGFHIEEGQVVVHDEPEATDSKAVKAIGVNWDACVIWVGMPVNTVSGRFLGYVDTVAFDSETGVVASLSTENGAANNAVLGKLVIPGKMVRGFRLGAGVPLESADGGNEEQGESGLAGTILVADEAAELTATGGVAAAAGKATAVVADKAKKGVAKTKVAAAEQAERARPVAQKAAKATGQAVEAGAYAAGKQLGRASGMFAAFKEEYKKAARGDDE